MGMLLYSALLAVGLVLSAPWWVVRMVTTERYRQGLRGRLGAVPQGLRDFVRGKRVVWVHAVSVGEVLAATRLVKELEEALAAEVRNSGVLRFAQDDGEKLVTAAGAVGEKHLDPEWVVVVSTTTRTGQALARERFGAARVFYMPLDFAFAVRAYLRVLRPAALVLMESELWPRLLQECGRGGVPVAVVNARVSDRSFARGMRVRGLWRWAFGSVRLWLAQSAEDARRLVALGAAAERVVDAGNLKFDVRATGQSRVAELIREVAAGRPVIVAGSTVDRKSTKSLSEEEMVVQAWEGRLRRESGVMLVLATRHPERFWEAEAVACEFRYVRASEWKFPTHDDETVMNGPPGFASPGPERIEIVLLDTIGDLAAVYGVADVAFVGGSLVGRGGHNPLEPAQFGVPVVMGPSYENFRGIVEAMRAAEGICIVGEGRNADSSASLRNDKGNSPGQGDGDLVEALEAELVRLVTDRDAARAMGERGRQVFEAQQGATGRAVAAVVAMMEQSHPTHDDEAVMNGAPGMGTSVTGPSDAGVGR